MNRTLRFEGWAGRAAYATASLAVFFSQHLIVLAPELLTGHPVAFPPLFWVNPLRVLIFKAVSGPDAPTPDLFVLGMAATFMADALLVWLAFRRSRRAWGGGWIASLAIVPVVQLAVIAWLTLCPDRREPLTEPMQRNRLDARTAVLSLMTGVGLIVGAVALSTLALRTYGVMLFLASPFIVGLVVGYLANRGGDIGLGATFSLMTCAFFMGGAALLGFAFEGAICLALASPLLFAFGGLGALLGTALAKRGRASRGTTLRSVAVLPVLLMAEAFLPPHGGFDSVESVEVAAPPAAVWDAVVHMGPIPDAPAAPFRWGLAYPLRGEIMGTGVGSIRRGVFSTGVAYERVTEWEPEKKLSFIVLSDPPSMRELSPYAQVNAPHDRDYFRTLDARFTLTPLAGGKTRLTLATRHALDLEPALYWTPLAEWAVHANKTRVLNHFREQAEAAALTPAP